MPFWFAQASGMAVSRKHGPGLVSHNTWSFGTKGGRFFMKANEDTPGQDFSLPTWADKLASQESYLPLSE